MVFGQEVFSLLVLFPEQGVVVVLQLADPAARISDVLTAGLSDSLKFVTEDRVIGNTLLRAERGEHLADLINLGAVEAEVVLGRLDSAARVGTLLGVGVLQFRQ